MCSVLLGNNINITIMNSKLTALHWLLTIKGILLVFLLSCQLSAIADNTAIKLTLSNGTTQFFILSEVPSAKYEGNTLIFSSQTQEVRVSLEDGITVKVTYLDVPDHIEEVAEKYHPVFEIGGECINMKGLEPNTVVFIYDLKGVLIAKDIVTKDGSASLPINGKGIFVIKTSVSSFKIKK